MINIWLHFIQNLMPDANITKHCFSTTLSEYQWLIKTSQVYPED